ncbi:hypothetical protein F5884DRAFT_355863 [Xylogone sp. PMI_703]|nr:hypothetical protein F5884DRAFT_355863 [Xylogone sp. PMI_703]
MYIALPRRATRGPLDADEAPIDHPLSPEPGSSQILSASSVLSRTDSQRSQASRALSPGVSSNPSFRTAVSNLSQPRKDFSHLLRPEIYHPLTLIDVPPPFRVPSLQPADDTSLETLIEGGHFRTAAIKAARLLTSSSIDTSDYSSIFNLVYTRLSCLTLCNQTQLASQEVKALEDLNSNYYRDDLTSEHLVPWELRVLAVRLQGMGFNDARRGVMGYYELAREVRAVLSHLKKTARGGESSDQNEAEIELWESRLDDLGIRVASALVEMEDLEGATRHLKTLKPREGHEAELVTKKALLWMCLGDIEAARQVIGGIRETAKEQHQTMLALAFMAEGRYGAAADVWKVLYDSSDDNTDPGEKAMWKQNLAVCLLYTGKMEEARKLLEQLVVEEHSFHALTFNLSTIYELCTERSRAVKIGLAEKVASMDPGSNVGWEKVNGDFKL